MMNRTTETGTRASVHIQPIKMKKVTFTSTPFINPQQKYQTMKEQYKDLLNKNSLTKEDLDGFRSLVDGLAAETDWYEEGLFKLRKLNKKHRKLQKSETKSPHETLEDLLISQKLVDFINIGASGRGWVVARLDEEEIRNLTEEEVKKQVNEKITLLDEHLSLLKAHDRAEGFMSRLAELDISFESDLLAGKVAEQLLLEDLSKVNTLSDLHKLIASVKKDIEETGIVDSTFEEKTFEQFHQTAKNE
ncbi:hypothetical protein SAMN04487936_108153 [Halobacillus dabanensis]|uniref:Uncharacterized protein n=1 Tax=Halobacillus dabanensis TaxID=240302 RepID=A0A1I3XEN2_HALDA|nr:hypothetical protein [Halobacillus dabanensis]SFK17988.1 hypothetical protein SAMN04487936_108153 [Halobacillus dabanensis]